MKGSVPCTTPAGGVGVTFTLEEKVGSKELANRSASGRLNLSDHFWSSSILLSVSDLVLTVFIDLEVKGSSFFAFLSGGATVRDLTVPWSSTAPITETDAGSTRVSLSLDGVESSFLASCYSFLSL